MVKRRIKIGEITKIEGHANLTIEIDNDDVQVKFGVHEGSRYFEAFMRGKSYRYLPELSGRICGICTVAHEIASVKAVERALGIEVSQDLENLRKLLLISSQIQSHILHLYFLSLPDYLGAESIMELAGRDMSLVKRAFNLKEATNYMTSLIGGRAVQPCTIGVGKITKKITKTTLELYYKKMKEIYPFLLETAEIFLSLEYPSFARENEYVSLYDGKNIPLYDGLIKTKSIVFRDEEYSKHIVERNSPYSSAKHSFLDDRDFMVGSLARLNLNPHLREEAVELAEAYGIRFPSDRVAFINVAQALENVHYALEGMEIAENLNEYFPKNVSISVKDGEGVGVIEAPRGLLIHHYRIRNGKCSYANIITPTAMSIENIERSLRDYIQTIISENDEYIKFEAEKIIRAYDPCISCSVHVLRAKKQ